MAVEVEACTKRRACCVPLGKKRTVCWGRVAAQGGVCPSSDQPVRKRIQCEYGFRRESGRQGSLVCVQRRGESVRRVGMTGLSSPSPIPRRLLTSGFGLSVGMAEPRGMSPSDVRGARKRWATDTHPRSYRLSFPAHPRSPPTMSPESSCLLGQAARGQAGRGVSAQQRSSARQALPLVCPDPSRQERLREASVGDT